MSSTLHSVAYGAAVASSTVSVFFLLFAGVQLIEYAETINEVSQIVLGNPSAEICSFPTLFSGFDDSYQNAKYFLFALPSAGIVLTLITFFYLKNTNYENLPRWIKYGSQANLILGVLAVLIGIILTILFISEHECGPVPFSPYLGEPPHITSVNSTTIITQDVDNLEESKVYTNLSDIYIIASVGAFLAFFGSAIFGFFGVVSTNRTSEGKADGTNYDFYLLRPLRTEKAVNWLNVGFALLAVVEVSLRIASICVIANETDAPWFIKADGGVCEYDTIEDLSEHCHFVSNVFEQYVEPQGNMQTGLAEGFLNSTVMIKLDGTNEPLTSEPFKNSVQGETLQEVYLKTCNQLIDDGVFTKDHFDTVALVALIWASVELFTLLVVCGYDVFNGPVSLPPLRMAFIKFGLSFGSRLIFAVFVLYYINQNNVAMCPRISTVDMDSLITYNSLIAVAFILAYVESASRVWPFYATEYTAVGFGI